MCSEEKLSYSAFPAGHIFRLGIAILVLTINCVIMRVAATFALANIQDSQAYCTTYPSACGVTAYSVLGSVLPILMAVFTGSFAIVASKRFFKWAFIATFTFGCVLMTISFLLNILFNALRHGFNIAPILVPDILEINLFCVLNLLSMVEGILCVKSLVQDRSEKYVARTAAAETDAATYELSDDVEAETQFQYVNPVTNGEPETVKGDKPSTSDSNFMRPTSPGQHNSKSMDRSRPRSKLARGFSEHSARPDSRIQRGEVAIVIENENGKVTNFDIFSIEANGGRSKK